MTTKLPQNAAVWFEIPVSDMAKAKAFYGEVVQAELIDEDSGPNPIAMFPASDMDKAVSGHIYVGTPSPEGTGNTVHLASPDRLEDAMKRVEKAGGTVVTPIISIPAGSFFYCRDPDGNSFAMFAWS